MIFLAERDSQESANSRTSQIRIKVDFKIQAKRDTLCAKSFHLLELDIDSFPKITQQTYSGMVWSAYALVGENNGWL